MQRSEDEMAQIDKILLVGGMTRMPMVRDMICKLSSVPLADDVNPDEAVAVGAAIQAMLSLLQRRGNNRGKMPAGRYAPAIFFARRRPHSGDDITSHTLGVVLWDEAHLEEYVFPMIQKMTAMPAISEKFVRHRHGQHAARDRADRRGRKHAAAGVHAAGDLRCRAAGLSSQRFAGGTDLRIQRQSGAGGRGRSLRATLRTSRSNATPAWRRVKLARQRLDWGR